MSRKLLLAGVVLTFCVSCGEPSPPVEPAPIVEVEQVAAVEVVTAVESDSDIVARAGAPLFSGMGDHSRPITASDPAVQRYFDQGMALAAGFNHAESIRSFRAAQRLDPGCAMCFWGEALATGPNINVTSNGKAVMQPAEREAALAAIQQAESLKSEAPQSEQDLIDALATRYDGNPDSPREPLDLAYADAMRGLAVKYPGDDDVQAMFAEALMTTMPWDYWLDAENPRPEAAEVIEALERVLARSPRHPLAIHLYIHTVEASSNPGRAEQAADTLAELVPGSGHLVHMPSHIYWRVGRYFDASEANVRAAAVDEQYIAQCNAQGFYPALYYPHNIHFLWASASMEGRSEVAIEAGRKVAANIRLEQIQEFPTVEFFHTVPLLSLVRFGHWDEILAEPQPEAELSFSNGLWHYARGIAMIKTGDTAGAAAEREALVALAPSDAVLFLDGVDYPASLLLEIAGHLLDGELSRASGDLNQAIEVFGLAVELQDGLPYTEPPFWYYPTRQTLGSTLLEAGDFEAAEAVFRADLNQYPRNGWSLYGLLQSLEGGGKTEMASDVRAQFENIWARADIELTSSVM
jgi:tetratricopeptide (TPR) repeat protein